MFTLKTKETTQKEKEFPKLMSKDDCIVIFLKKGVGVYLSGNYIGQLGRDIHMFGFEDYNDEVIIRNV